MVRLTFLVPRDGGSLLDPVATMYKTAAENLAVATFIGGLFIPAVKKSEQVL